MASDKPDLLNDLQVTRRLLINSGAALAAAPLAACAAPGGAQKTAGAASAGDKLEPPFDSIRDFVTALEQRGLLQRFDGVDQDSYEATAIMYRLIDEFGLRDAPAVMFTNLRANGRRYPGPVVANLQGNLRTEPLLLGGEVVPDDAKATYQNVTRKMLAKLVASEGVWDEIEPREVPAEAAPVKQVRLEGDEIDVLAFPFLRGNPGDAGPYINTASVFTRDPGLGVNFGTYRCQIKGPRKIMINFEGGQTGIKMVDAARKRGETSMPITLVVGQDPLTWMVSSSRIPSRIRNRGPIDELAVAGGLRGKAVDVVRTESGTFLVPANAEIVIEGTVDIVNLEEEGPYHEMYGYLGHKKERNYVMTAQTMTHRKDPWVMNSFTGVVREYITSPQRAENIYNLRKSHPQVVDYESPHDSQGLVYISIKKGAPGQALEVARPTAMFNPLARVVIVVDDDVDVLDSSAVRFAVGSRWQPALASEIIENRRAFPLDPASPDRLTTSKIIIDATRQWPEEGGPKIYQRLNRTVFEEAAPDAIAKVLAKWPDKLNK
ncbi:MAG: UbiD family decarboxylase [Gammaproteobacteria bacterium]|jgi:UbiD family decarboxylase|nr:UbiD family decarboxylase [Gammaproteobacteria bacterium]